MPNQGFDPNAPYQPAQPAASAKGFDPSAPYLPAGPNLVTGEGMDSYAQSQAKQQQNATVHPVSRTSGILARGPQTVEQDPQVAVGSAGTRSGMGLPGNLSNKSVQTEPESQAKADAKNALILAGSAVAPEILPETAGLLATGAAAGAGAGAGTVAGQALTGEDPTSAKSLKETGTNALEYGGATVVGGAVAKGIGKGLEKLRVTAPDTEGWLHIRSEGRLYQIHPEDLEAAKAADPSLKIVGSNAPTLANSTPKGQSAQQAGKTVQQELQTTKNAVGEQVGQAKDAVRDSLPTTSTGEPAQMTIQPESKVSVQANDLLKNEIPGLNKSETDLVNKLASGQDADGGLVSMSTQDIERTKQQLTDSIDRLSKTPGNKTAAGQMKQLKASFDNDVYDFYEKVGDPDAAQDLRKFSTEYAKVNKDLTKGPAAGFFKTNKPETIVSGIIKNGANAQSGVEALAKNMSPESMDILRQSVTKDLYRRSTLPNGDIDMMAVQNRLASLGDTAKALYGDTYADVKALIDTAAEIQKAKPDPSQRFIRKGIAKAGKSASTLLGAGIGAKVGMPGAGAIAGSVVGEDVANEILNFGKSGAVKIGISPSESIVLTPKQTMRAGMGKLIAKFANAQKYGKPTAAIVTAINSLVGGDSSSEETPSQDPQE
jgi:hypothetical protein